MKRYRIDPKLKNSRFAKYINGIYFVFGWNVLAIGAYQLMKPRMKEKHSDWDSMSWSQQYLSMVHAPESRMTVIRGSGLQHYSTKNLSVDEFTTTDDKQSIPTLEKSS